MKIKALKIALAVTAGYALIFGGTLAVLAGLVIGIGKIFQVSEPTAVMSTLVIVVALLSLFANYLDALRNLKQKKVKR